MNVQSQKQPQYNITEYFEKEKKNYKKKVTNKDVIEIE